MFCCTREPFVDHGEHPASPSGVAADSQTDTLSTWDADRTFRTTFWTTGGPEPLLAGVGRTPSVLGRADGVEVFHRRGATPPDVFEHRVLGDPGLSSLEGVGDRLVVGD